MLFYAINIFLSAFLLFQIQPLMGKLILPWFGGTPAVWSTVMLFFQVLLTGGYAYSYWLISKLPARRQAWVHGGLLAASLIVMLALGIGWPSPITPNASWKPPATGSPIAQIFVLLGAAVGLPYFLLSTNSTLTQAWFHRRFPEKSPYWLYALSNTGSMLGLLAYPTLVEPNLTVQSQGWGWFGAYALFVALTGFSVARIARGESAALNPAREPKNPGETPNPSFFIQFMWLARSATASMMLLATTSQVTQEVAVIPFLWVLPLAVYLLSFIITFSSERAYARPWGTALLAAASGLYFWILFGPAQGYVTQIGIYSLLLLAITLVCHGELYALRPNAAHLTRFYLLVSVGGALGGLFVNLAAPVLFKGYWEFTIGFGLAWLLLALTLIARRTRLTPRWRLAHDILALALAGSALGTSYFILTSASGDIWSERNFYGVIRVRASAAGDAYVMVHGVTVHGMQFTAPEKRRTPMGYYVPQSGGGQAILTHPQRGMGMRVGLLGLGAGTLAAYSQAGDVYTFYEINPVSERLARGEGGFFSFLSDSPAEIRVEMGDARLTLERQLAAGERQNFDVLALDTFSSDSIPTHLMTREAFALYLEHLAPKGVLAVHISNRYLDLQPVLARLAQNFGLAARVVEYAGDEQGGVRSIWVLMARQETDLAVINGAPLKENPSIRLWTDDYSNLFQILK